MAIRIHELKRACLMCSLVLSFYNGFAQNLKSKDDTAYNYSIGSDLILNLTSLTMPDSIFVVKSDLPADSVRIDLRTLKKREDRKGDMEVFVGRFQYPGLCRVNAYIIQVDSTIHPFDTTYFYIPSPKTSQDAFPQPINSFLDIPRPSSSRRLLEASLHQLNDSLHLIFSKMKNVVPRDSGLIAYDINTRYYDAVDSFITHYSEKFDSGIVIQGSFFVDLWSGITLFNGDGRSSMDTVLTVRDSLIANIFGHWQSDTLVHKEDSIFRYITPWMSGKFDSQDGTEWPFFKRTDSTMTSDVLRRYARHYSDSRSLAYFGFGDSKEDQLVIAFRLLGSYVKKEAGQ